MMCLIINKDKHKKKNKLNFENTHNIMNSPKKNRNSYISISSSGSGGGDNASTNSCDSVIGGMDSLFQKELLPPK